MLARRGRARRSPTEVERPARARATNGQIRPQVLNPCSVSTLQLTPSQWHLAETSGAGDIVVVAMTRTGMWLWIPSKRKAGRRWARILSAMCFVIDSLALVRFSARPTPIGECQLLFPGRGLANASAQHVFVDGIVPDIAFLSVPEGN